MKCFRHDFETNDVEQWDWHCYSTGHKLEIQAKYDDNGKWYKFEKPYPRHHMRDELMKSNSLHIEFDP
jgi:hypothetical protein